MSSLRRSASTKSSWRIFLNPDPYLAELRGFPSLHCGPEVQKASPSDDHRAHFICLPSFRDQFCLTYFQHLKTLYIFLSSFLAYVGRASLVSFISAWAEAEVRQPVVSFSDSYLWVVALLFYRVGKGGRKRGRDTLMCKRTSAIAPHMLLTGDWPTTLACALTGAELAAHWFTDWHTQFSEPHQPGLNGDLLKTSSNLIDMGCFVCFSLEITLIIANRAMRFEIQKVQKRM